MLNDKNLLAVAETYNKMRNSELGVIYCDMDGVLVDFIKGAESVLGHTFDSYKTDFAGAEREVEKKKTRNTLMKHAKFWENLPVMSGAMQLWNFINKYNPHILTAYASWDPRSKEGKLIWIKKHLKNIPNENFHAVQRVEKRDYARDDLKKNILIDDYLKNITEFENAGGIGIHHINAETTISKLKKLGFQ